MIRYTESGTTLYLTASGHITAKFCAQIRERIFNRFENEPLPQRVYADMTECTYMDSTFIGLLAGINKRLKKASGNKLVLQNVQEVCIKLLKSMGMIQLLEIASSPIAFPENMEIMDSESKPEAQDILEAHEELMEISDDNKSRFSLLHSILSHEVEEKKKDNGN